MPEAFWKLIENLTFILAFILLFHAAVKLGASGVFMKFRLSKVYPDLHNVEEYDE